MPRESSDTMNSKSVWNCVRGRWEPRQIKSINACISGQIHTICAHPAADRVRVRVIASQHVYSSNNMQCDGV